MIEPVRILKARRSSRALALAGVIAGLAGAVLVVEARAANLSFRRGDVDSNQKLEMADALRTLGFLFLGSPTSLGCQDAADSNDSGKVDLSDALYTLSYMFTGGPVPAAPGIDACGPDPSADGLTCDLSPGCPQDPTPPSAPTGLTALAGDGQVSLDWANNPEPDVAGYNVYRSTTEGSGHVKINGSLLAGSSHIDGSVSNGTRYYYRVTALDAGAEESALSAEVSALPNPTTAPSLKDAGHLLNRIAYGPTQAEIERVTSIGLEAYMSEQLNPGSIDESGNTALNTRVNALFSTVTPTRDTALLPAGAVIRYLKGTEEPPADWRTTGFNAAAWAVGVTGIGYGDGDDATVLVDMEQNLPSDPGPDYPGYMSVYLRTSFNVPDASAPGTLNLVVDYDDGFVAYLNGTEVARRGLTGAAIPAFNAAGASHEAGTPETIDISSKKNLLVNGTNVLAVQIHNSAITSGDLSMLPVIVLSEPLGEPPVQVIGSLGKLQQLVHVRGVYSKRQLQAVLAEFWQNHFTWDVEKVKTILDEEVKRSDGSDAFSPARAEEEAAQLAYEDYQFLYDNALGNFGDLLLYSASSPSMIWYLDNYLNKVGVANENYAREILELYGFGVDNRYTQKDIEQLAKCFTGWSVCKIARENDQSFPASAETPPAVCGIQFTDTTKLALGGGWKYLKGTAEPTPDGGGAPTTAWTQIGFVDTAWTSGSTGIGYGDSDDATVLNDMQNSYLTVYLRHHFTLSQAEIENPDSFILEIEYDDGFVAYVNGQEVARSYSMRNSARPPAYNDPADENHEVTQSVDVFSLNSARGVLIAGDNVLAIQAHNGSRGSSDLSMKPRLKFRHVEDGSIENDAPLSRASWTFFFNAADHDLSQKILFDNTPYKITVPANRTGALGLKDALDPVKSFVNHPSTAEFISIKLIQKFVSDEISVQTKSTASLALRNLLADCIAAWNSTTPKGNIEKVLRVILDPVDRQGQFWAPGNYRNKLRTPTEYNIASARVLGAALSGTGLAGVTNGMSWPVFTRDEPDGNPEAPEFFDTGHLRDRVDYVQTLTENKNAEYSWSTLQYLDSRGLADAQEIVDHFSDLLFHGTLSTDDKNRLIQFLTTDNAYNPKALVRSNTADFQTRVQELVGLMLSLPQWQFQ